MSLLDAPIWHDAGTWIVLGVSLLSLLMGLALFLVIRRVLRAPPPGTDDAP